MELGWGRLCHMALSARGHSYRQEVRTVTTSASVSPVVGHFDTIVSPEPRHEPSYKPGSADPPWIPSGVSTFDARVDRHRATRRRLTTFVRAQSMAVGGESKVQGYPRYRDRRKSAPSQTRVQMRDGGQEQAPGRARRRATPHDASLRSGARGRFGWNFLLR